jgi:hypothetical protein
VICRPGLWAESRLKPAAQSRAEPEPGGRLTAAYGSGFKFGKPFSQAQAQGVFGPRRHGSGFKPQAVASITAQSAH